MTESDAERRAARAAIMQRRSKLMACAVAASVATSACGKKVCLSISVDGTGGTPVTSGGRGFCLTAPMGGSAFGGVGSLGGGGSVAAGSGGVGGGVATGEAGATAAGAGGEPAGGEGGDAPGGQGGTSG